MVAFAAYMLTEASSGTGPTTTADAAPSPVSAAVNYAGASQWTSNSGGNGFGINGTAANIAAALGATKWNGIYGNKFCTVMQIVDFNTAGMSDPFSQFWGMDNPGIGEMFVYAGDGTCNIILDSFSGTVDITSVTTGLRVFTYVFDYLNGSSTQRWRVYVDGVQLPAGTSSGTTLGIPTGSGATLGFGGGLPGGIYSFLWYNEVLSDATIADYSAQLVVNNDVEPSSGSVAPTNAIFFGAGTTS